MDSDSKKQKAKIPRNYYSYGGNVFQSAWFRRIVQTSDELDRFLLDYGFDFLPAVSFLFWTIFLFAQAT